VVSRFYLDLPHEEVAALLGCSPDAAKATVRRAMQHLQRAHATSGDER
jgi:DNA-directed RNA polymerase specialized sigma24 family protein